MGAHGQVVEIPGTGTSDHVRVNGASADVHASEGVPLFQVFVDGGRVVLTGSVDTFTADRLAAALAATPVEGPPTVLDLGRLDFLDVAGCRVIARWAQEVLSRQAQLQVTGASRLAERMWQLLRLDELAPVTFTEARP